MDEKTVILAVKAGDTEAYGQIVQAYEKQIYNLCLRMVSDPADAEDLAQEAFVKAWHGLEFYKFEAAFSTWLYRLTTNLCIDFLRKKKRRPSVSMTVEEDGESSEMEFPDPSLTPEEEILRRERQQMLRDAMETLDEEGRAIITLRVVDELSYEQIAKVLDVKVGTVKSRLARARDRLRKILHKQGNIPIIPSSKSADREDTL